VKRGEVYQFAWDSAGTKYGGVGVLQGNGLAVAYSEGTDGTGCGVVLYQIKADGVLDGKAGYFGVNTDEDERAVPTADGRGLSKGYRVTGKTPKGESYSGTLRIEPSGPGFDLVWNTGKELRGFGIARGSQIAASFGGNQCAFVYYKVLRDGTLDGEWGGLGSRTLGTEIARKRRYIYCKSPTVREGDIRNLGSATLNISPLLTRGLSHFLPSVYRLLAADFCLLITTSERMEFAM
jgi:hypothetical protein